MGDVVVILHNIRSAQNVGSMFRTADAAGVKKIYLSGYTPRPIDRFGRKRSDVAKASLGAESIVSWEEASDIHELLSMFKKEGRKIIAIEQCADSIDYKTFQMDNPLALIFGNEVEGVDEKVLAGADAIIEIPMRGSKESLNVAVAAGIVLYRLLDR